MHIAYLLHFHTTASVMQAWCKPIPFSFPPWPTQEDDNVDPTELLDTEELASAADASFMLAVLAATGIATTHVSLNDSWAVKALHAAAQGGSPEAHLALAHRYFMGDGVPGNCQEGLRSGPCSFCCVTIMPQT